MDILPSRRSDFASRDYWDNFFTDSEKAKAAVAEKELVQRTLQRILSGMVLGLMLRVL